MLGIGIGSLIARWGFWLLLGYGWWTAELSTRRAIVFVILWVLASVGFWSVPVGAWVFTAIVAMLDVALVLLIFKGDIKIS